MSPRRSWSGVAAAIAVSVALGLAPAPARAATSVPPFPSDGVALAGVRDTFTDLRAWLGAFRSAVGARYVVAIVARTDAWHRDGASFAESAWPYAELTFETWRGSLDPARDVVLVVSVTNRSVAVRPGSHWRDLGVTRAVLDGVLDAVGFAAVAQKEDHDAALRKLIPALDAALADRQRAVESGRARIGGEIAALEQASGALAARVADAGQAGGDARAMLDAGQAALGASKAALEAGDVERASAALVEARRELDWSTRTLARALLEEKLWRVWVPIAFGVIVLLSAILVWSLLRRRRPIYGQAAWDIVVRWEQRIETIHAWLRGMANRHPVLFGTEGLAARFTGDTARRFLPAAAMVDEINARLGAARGVLAAARELMADRDNASPAQLRKAADMLTGREVSYGPETAHDAILLGAPIEPRRLKAGELLERLDGIQREAERLCGPLEAAILDASRELRRILDALARVDDMLAMLPVAATSLSPYRQEWRAIRDAQQAVRRRLHFDPLGALAGLADLGTRTRRLVSRVRRLRRTAEVLGWDVDHSIARTWEGVRLLRSLGMTLQEPSLEPEAVTQQVWRLADEARRLAAEGDDTGAWEKAVQARQQTHELAEQVRRAVEARVAIPGELQALTQQVKALKARLPERSRRLAELRARYADAALDPALDNIEEARTAIRYAERAIAAIWEDLSPDAQRYVAAQRHLARTVEIVAQVEALYAEIEEKASAMVRDADAAESALREADESMLDLEKELEEGARFASSDLVFMARGLRERLDREWVAQEARRPDWPSLRRRAVAVAERTSAVLKRAEAEREAMARFAERHLRVVAERDRTGVAIPRGDADEAGAEGLFQAAVQALEDLEPLANPGEGKRADWAQALARLEQAATLLEEARAVSRPDWSVRQRARGAVARAAERIGAADRDYGYSVRADLEPARQALDDAEAAMAADDARGALQSATQAHRGAIDAEWAAFDRVRFLEMREIDRALEPAEDQLWGQRAWWQRVVGDGSGPTSHARGDGDEGADLAPYPETAAVDPPSRPFDPHELPH